MQDTPEKEYYEIEDLKTHEKQKNEKNSSSEEHIYDLFNIEPYQFIQVYHNQIVPAFKFIKISIKAGDQEQAGNQLTKGVCWTGIVVMSVLIVTLLISAFTEKQAGNRIASFVFAMVVSLYMFIPIFMLLRVRKVDRYIFKERFFSFFNVEYSRYTRVEKHGNRAFIRGELPGKELFSAMEKMAVNCFFIIDESLKFNYKGKTLELSEFNNRTDSESLLMVSYFITKNFHGEIILKSINEDTKPSFTSKQKINLEDPVFNEKFSVFADDQVEARYVLTTSFMERLLTFQRKYHCTVSALFSNNITPKSNIFLSLSFGKDFFELPKGEKWINDPSYFYNICQEIKEIAQILDAVKDELKLDQDIGM